jgi:purine-binding chemotaxis protein CheW
MSFLTDPKAPVQERRLIQFYINGRAYAIDVHRVQEIIYSREATPIPMSARYVLGVIELRGQILPVIDLRERLCLADGGSEQSIAKGTSHILIVKIGARMAGLKVDEVREVIKLQSVAVCPPEQLLAADECKFLEGIIHIGDRMLLVLDMDQLLSPRDLDVHVR